MTLSVMSAWLLNSFGGNDLTMSLASMFQCLVTFSMNIFFLISILNHPWYNLRLFLHFQSLVSWGRDQLPTYIVKSYRLISCSFKARAALCLLFSRLKNYNSLGYSSLDLCSTPALWLSSGHVPAPQRLCCSEDLQIKYSIPSAASPVPRTIPCCSAGHTGAFGRLGTHCLAFRWLSISLTCCPPP